jgi:hypothetical protein
MMYMEWESDLYDFSDPEVRLKYVPQLGCSVGGAISPSDTGASIPPCHSKKYGHGLDRKTCRPHLKYFHLISDFQN